MSTSKLTPNGGEKIIVTNTEQKIPEHKTQKQTEGENFEILDMTRVIRVIHDYTMRRLGPFPSSIFHPVRNPSHNEISNLDFYQSRLDVENLHQIDMFSNFFIFLLFY